MGKDYISVEHHSDGSTTVKDHGSKKDAHTYGKAKRLEGKDIFVHPKAFADQFGLDPRKKDSQHAKDPKQGTNSAKQWADAKLKKGTK